VFESFVVSVADCGDCGSQRSSWWFFLVVKVAGDGECGGQYCRCSDEGSVVFRCSWVCVVCGSV